MPPAHPMLDARSARPTAHIANTKTQRHEGRWHTRFFHRFLDSTFGSARNDKFFAVPSVCPDREGGATIHDVIPTKRAERRFTMSSRPRERSDDSRCHPDRESGANEWRDLWARFRRVGGQAPRHRPQASGGWAERSNVKRYNVVILASRVWVGGRSSAS